MEKRKRKRGREEKEWRERGREGERKRKTSEREGREEERRNKERERGKDERVKIKGRVQPRLLLGFCKMLKFSFSGDRTFETRTGDGRRGGTPVPNRSPHVGTSAGDAPPHPLSPGHRGSRPARGCRVSPSPTPPKNVFFRFFLVGPFLQDPFQTPSLPHPHVVRVRRGRKTPSRTVSTVTSDFFLFFFQSK